MPNPAKQQNISVSPGQTQGTYVIDPVCDIDMRNMGQGVIQWDVVTSGWNFAANGIWFKSNSNQMQNTPGQIPGQPNRWQANDLNSNLPQSLVTYGISL